MEYLYYYKDNILSRVKILEEKKEIYVCESVIPNFNQYIFKENMTLGIANSPIFYKETKKLKRKYENQDNRLHIDIGFFSTRSRVYYNPIFFSFLNIICDITYKEKKYFFTRALFEIDLFEDIIDEKNNINGFILRINILYFIYFEIKFKNK